ncbi:MAG: hypothetical protein ACHQ2E_01170 [Gemmatimonadales bacterium]
MAGLALLIGLLGHEGPILAQAGPRTPATVLAQVTALGPDSAFQRFYADSTIWNQLIGAVSAGDTTWFPVSDALEPARSTHARGLRELDDAMIASLARQPAALFTYHLSRGWSPAQIAEAFCVELPDAPQGAAEELQAAIIAVEGVKAPPLKSTRDACLKAFQRMQS